MRKDSTIEKLKAMTVEAGCTEAEAKTAASLLAKLLAKTELQEHIGVLLRTHDPLLTVEQVADKLNLTVPTVFKNVASGWLPLPTYVAPKAPRWRLSWINQAIEARRQMPRDAVAERRAAKLARLRIKPTAGAEPHPTA